MLVESELLEDKSAQKIAKEKKTKNYKSGVDNIKLIQCNVLGEKKILIMETHAINMCMIMGVFINPK